MAVTKSLAQKPFRSESAADTPGVCGCVCVGEDCVSADTLLVNAAEANSAHVVLITGPEKTPPQSLSTTTHGRQRYSKARRRKREPAALEGGGALTVGAHVYTTTNTISLAEKLPQSLLTRQTAQNLFQEFL